GHFRDTLKVLTVWSLLGRLCGGEPGDARPVSFVRCSVTRSHSGWLMKGGGPGGDVISGSRSGPGCSPRAPGLAQPLAPSPADGAPAGGGRLCDVPDGRVLELCGRLHRVGGRVFRPLHRGAGARGPRRLVRRSRPGKPPRRP